MLIIGIEFLEFFTDDEGEEDEDAKPRKRKGNAYYRKLFRLESGRGSLRSSIDKNGPIPVFQSAASPAGGEPAQGYLANYDEGLSSGEDKVQVIGSKTYTVRTVLEGNYIYLEEVEERAAA